MPLRRHLHAFLCFLPAMLLSSCLLVACRVAYGQSPPPSSSSSNNGQQGTPNLPLAISRFIDTNHMRGNATQSGVGAATLSLATNGLKKFKADITLPALKQLAAQLNSLQESSPSNRYQSVYTGIEIRGGSGRTNYTVPEISYTNERIGYELGADFLSGTGSENHYSLFGFSARYEVTNQGRALTREIGNNAEAIASDRQELLNIINSNKIVASVSKLLEEKTRNPDVTFDLKNPDFLKILLFQGILITNFPNLVKKTDVVKPPDDLAKAIALATIHISALITNTDNLGTHIVRQSESPALSIFASTHLINGSGTVTSEGFSASKLFSFGKDNQPGVTLLYVVQGIEATVSPGYRHSAVQNGAAVIFQDRTPAKSKDYAAQFEDDATNKSYVNLLRPPWNVKIGVEYTAPVLGLTKAYTGFVRYRDPRSYAEITLAVGENGQGKDYGSVNIGRSFLF